MAPEPDPDLMPPTPLPASEAREQALATALARFEAHHGLKREKTAQGFLGLARPKEGHTPSRTSVMLRTRLAVATASLLAIAAPLAWTLHGERAGPPIGQAPVDKAPIGAAPVGEPPAPPAVDAAKEQSSSNPLGTPEGTRKPETGAQADKSASRAPPGPAAPETRQPQAEAPALMAEIAAPPPSLSPPSLSPPSPPPDLARPAREASRAGAADNRAPLTRTAPAAPPPAVLARPAPAREALAQTVAPQPRTRQAPPGEAMPQEAEPVGRDTFVGEPQDAFRGVREAPVSTFSIDVDTAAYGFVRASLNRNRLPPKEAVRPEELINYFPYAYEGPASAAEPFRITSAVFPSPWAPERKLVQVAVKGYALAPASRPRANLVFLVDTSGSMNAPNRLPLVKQALAMLLTQLDARDRVAIVTYAGRAGTALEPTPANETAKILGVLETLESGGGTAGGEGIRQAYALAERSSDPEGVNRVVLATDGDFNIGITSRDELKGFVERERRKGIFLSVLGFGMGNHNDALMQALAQNGNGAAAYIDTLAEARKVLVEEATSTLIPIAKDVKIQVEFNPALVAEYRLIGYETRRLAREDFSNDAVDAGDVGSGQSVTALYEIVPAGGKRMVGDLRYGKAGDAPAAVEARSTAESAQEYAQEYANVAVRYKLPKSEASALIAQPITRAGEAVRFEEAPHEARFATAVAGFSEILRGGKYTGGFGLDDVLRIGAGARGEDAFGYRAEFLQLVRAAKTAKALSPHRP